MTISTAQATEIRAQVRQAIQEGFAKARAPMGRIPKKHKLYQNAFYFDAKSGTADPSKSVIDLVTPSTISPQVAELGALPASPISVASTLSNDGNGGSALEFLRMLSGSHATSPPQVFEMMHWKPKEPPYLLGHSTEDVHTWTPLVRHYLTLMGGSDAQ